MREETFTPGPWKIAGFGSTNNNKMDFGINTELGQLVIESYGQCELDCKANAALIAAAPEMYEQLKRHCALCMMMHPDCEGCEICDTGKALMKARGEE